MKRANDEVWAIYPEGDYPDDVLVHALLRRGGTARVVGDVVYPENLVPCTGEDQEDFDWEFWEEIMRLGEESHQETART